jgi:hypothetical protein
MVIIQQDKLNANTVKQVLVVGSRVMDHSVAQVCAGAVSAAAW